MFVLAVILICSFVGVNSDFGFYKWNPEDRKSMFVMRHAANVLIIDINRRIENISYVRADNMESPSFEVGYITYMLQELYRHMVDKYNASYFQYRKLYVIELVMLLEEIEHHYWEIEHYSNMLHEIPRKYKIHIPEGRFVETPPTKSSDEVKGRPYPRLPTRKKKKRMKKGFFDIYFKTTRSKKRYPFPLHYGWSIEECGLSEKLSVKKDILDELSWSVKLMLLNDNYALKGLLLQNKSRRVGVEALTLAQRRQAMPDLPMTVTPPARDNDENNMRLKLFRLMYETVRDSDLKYKRAELIKSHYVNYTSFDIGFLMGEVTDKFNIISDVSTTLKRLYTDWTPIEHINAYEQIANQAIEIGQLIDMAKLISKRNNTL